MSTPVSTQPSRVSPDPDPVSSDVREIEKAWAEGDSAHAEAGKPLTIHEVEEQGSGNRGQGSGLVYSVPSGFVAAIEEAMGIAGDQSARMRRAGELREFRDRAITELAVAGELLLRESIQQISVRWSPEPRDLTTVQRCKLCKRMSRVGVAIFHESRCTVTRFERVLAQVCKADREWRDLIAVITQPAAGEEAVQG